MFASNTSQVSSDAVYVEDVFSTYLYTGTGSSQTITNGIDLSGKGGLVWTKARNLGDYNILIDTVRGVNNALASDLTNAQFTYANTVTAFSSTGFTAGTTYNGYNVATWTFRKAKKFFDVVTYTGDGTDPRSIAHNLGSTPGCIIIKRTDTTADWVVRHRSMYSSSPWSSLALLNTTAARYSSNDHTPTSTTFVVGDNGARPNTNVSGATYVAYLFAHDAGGFGASGNDSVIACGGGTTNGSGVLDVNLGWEPQFVMVKDVASDRGNPGGGWILMDTMRGFTVNTGSNNYLVANASDSEYASLDIKPNATGFRMGLYANEAYIYIAIRRGPMKTPTSGTSVLETTAYSGNNTANRTIGTSLTTDLLLLSDRQGTSSGWASYAHYIFDRLRGEDVALATSTSNAESSGWANTYFNLDQQIGWSNGSNYNYLNSGVTTYASYSFRRAPGFMDVVCYTGTGSARTVAHNLGVAPELMIVKRRTNPNGDGGWAVYPNNPNRLLQLRYDSGEATISGSSSEWNGTAPTASVFSLGSYGTVIDVNASGQTFVAYLFASCPGVSKVGSYTGTGTTLQIDCGFTSGARFVLIKRKDSTGDWYVWDTARGIVSGNDPYILLNSTAAEVTNTDYIDAYSAGFEISSTAPAAINASGGTFIYLAIS